MSNLNDVDAVIVGSGPNGLAAAVTLLQTGLKVLIIEAKNSIGGGMRTQALTLPGYLHDVCSAIHPLAAGSSFFKGLMLEDHGLEWIYPTVAVAHPLDDGTAVFLTNSVSETAASLGQDKENYQKCMKPFFNQWNTLLTELLTFPFRPHHPLVLARFGFFAVQSAKGFVKRTFSGSRAKALFAGLAAHSMLPLESKFTTAIGLLLGLSGHKIGWPMPKGGSQKISGALERIIRSLGGIIQLNNPVRNFSDLPASKVTIFDVTPRQLLNITGDKFSGNFRRQLEKFRYGSGIFKVDLALNSPIPWKAKVCFSAGTIHVGGTLEEICDAENQVWRKSHPEKPFVLLAQQSLFDPSRAPKGKHTAWAYCHVPSGSVFDMTDRIENQIERFAPGFKDCIIKRHKMTAKDFEDYNPNYIGGDINGGVQNWRQFFTRPSIRINPYTTPDKKIFICSSSTPPGGGVHGMCGYNAAQTVLRKIY